MKQIIEEGAAGAAPGQETMIPLIETAHISKRFGGIVALNDAQMKCYRGAEDRHQQCPGRPGPQDRGGVPGAVLDPGPLRGGEYLPG